MRDLHENLGWIIGSAIAGIATFLSLMWESGLLSTLIGIIIGAGIAYFVQTRTQKRAWKREYSVRIAEEVYGSLFRGVKGIILSLKNKGYWHTDFSVWREMQDDHRYFMVDKGFRGKLDQFRERLEKYSRTVVKVREEILPKIANEETERVFNLEAVRYASLEVHYKEKRSNVSAEPNIIDCLVSKTHPKDHVLRDKSGISNVEFDIRIQKLDGNFYHSDELAKFDEFWESCVRRTKENKNYKFIIEENEKLLEEARKLKQEIANRIEEPWKI